MCVKGARDPYGRSREDGNPYLHLPWMPVYTGMTAVSDVVKGGLRTAPTRAWRIHPSVLEKVGVKL